MTQKRRTNYLMVQGQPLEDGGREEIALKGIDDALAHALELAKSEDHGTSSVIEYMDKGPVPFREIVVYADGHIVE